MEKKVSLLMSVYFEENDLLKRSIEAICAQTFDNFELLIVNDKSNEANSNLLNEFEKKDPRIKIIHNKENLGLTKSLNKAAGISQGSYLARIDSDDFCDPERLKTQVEFLDENPKTGRNKKISSSSSIIAIKTPPLERIGLFFLSDVP